MENKTPDIQTWLAEKLKVTRYPVLTEITAPEGKWKDYVVFLNVSDEFYMDYVLELSKTGRQHFWFPMGECETDMGLSSLFGALQVLYNCWERDMSVLLHCHAGINRSPTTLAAFFFMMTGKHIEEQYSPGGKILIRSNMLIPNCGKHLPSIEKMDLWLTACKKAFDEPHRFLGGMFDWTLREAGIYQEPSTKTT